MMKQTLKQNLREQYKKLRDEKDALAAAVADAKILEKLLEISQNFKTIFCYVAFGSEVPTYAYIQKVLAQGKTVCVPFLENDEMLAVQIHTLKKLKPNRFGILEPASSQNLIEKSKIELAVVPMLAFYQKSRLGFGGGFYDRFLKNCPARKVGIAYSFQQTKMPFAEKHDIEMDKIIYY